MQHGLYRHVRRLVLELSNRCGHGWLCIVGALGGGHNAITEVVERAETSWIYEVVVAR
jgi:hypothetical protein